MELGKEEAPDEKIRSELEESEKQCDAELGLLDTSESKELETVVEASIGEMKDFTENSENIANDVVEQEKLDQDPHGMIKDVAQEEAEISSSAGSSESKSSNEENKISEVESAISVDKLVEEVMEKLVETDLEAQSSKVTEESIVQPAEASAAADDKIVDREIIENSSETIVGAAAEECDIDRMDIDEEKDNSTSHQTESTETQMKGSKEKESSSTEGK